MTVAYEQRCADDMKWHGQLSAALQVRADGHLRHHPGLSRLCLLSISIFFSLYLSLSFPLPLPALPLPLSLLSPISHTANRQETEAACAAKGGDVMSGWCVVCKIETFSACTYLDQVKNKPSPTSDLRRRLPPLPFRRCCQRSPHDDTWPAAA